LIVREAGGMAAGDRGGLDFLSSAFIVASNGHIHEQMLRMIREGVAAPITSGSAWGMVQGYPPRPPGHPENGRHR
jgi:hypothetical protein